MNTFDDRKKGFENKFTHDQELKFKSEARRNKLLGAWAAKQFGLTGADVDLYVKSVLKADLAAPGDDDVFQKLKKDFADKGVEQSDHQIRRTMDEMLAEAVKQIESERT